MLFAIQHTMWVFRLKNKLFYHYCYRFYCYLEVKVYVRRLKSVFLRVASYKNILYWTLFSMHIFLLMILLSEEYDMACVSKIFMRNVLIGLRETKGKHLEKDMSSSFRVYDIEFFVQIYLNLLYRKILRITCFSSLLSKIFQCSYDFKSYRCVEYKQFTLWIIKSQGK